MADTIATAGLTVVLDDLGFGPQIVRLEAGDLAIDFAPAPLFQLRFRSIVNGLIWTVEAGTNDVTLPTAAAIDGGFEISWSLCAPGDRDLVNVMARLVVDGDHVDLSIRVDARVPKFSLYEVVFPVLRIRPVGDPASNVLAVPWLGGIIMRDPIHTTAALSPQFALRIDYLAFLVMQFSAYYLPDGPMLYVQATDGEGILKRFEWVGQPPQKGVAESEGTTRFQARHFPIDNAFEGNDIHAPAAYDMPYRMRLALTRGGWYAAAKRYRAWGLDQKWAGRGKIESSPEFPDTFKTLDFGLLRSRLGTDQLLDDFSIYLEELKRFADFFGTSRILVLWFNWHRHPFDTNWPEWRVKPSAIEAVAGARSEGFLVSLYTYMVGWDVNTRAWNLLDGPKRSAKDDHGNLRFFFNPFTNATFTNLNFSREETRDLVVDLWRRLASEIESDGYYLDNFGNSPILDQDRSLPEAGGSSAWERGKRELAFRLRDTFRERTGPFVRRPAFGFTAEFGDEFLLDAVDISGNTTDLRPPDSIPIPLYETVYHEYQMTAETLQPRPGAEHLRELSEVATGFHAGRIFAFVSLETNKTLLDRPFEGTPQFELWEFFRTLVQRGREVRRYQRFGERLRALPGSYEDLLDRGPTPDPSVQSSVWLAGNDFGLLLTNTAVEPRSFKIAMSPAAYPLPEPAGLVESKEDGTYVLLGLFGGGIEQEVTIAPRSLLVVEVLSAVRAIELTVPPVATQIGPLSLTIDAFNDIITAELVAGEYKVPNHAPLAFETLVSLLELVAKLRLFIDTSNDRATWTTVTPMPPEMQAVGTYLMTVDSVPGAWLRLRYSFTYGMVSGIPATTVFHSRVPEALVVPQVPASSA